MAAIGLDLAAMAAEESGLVSAETIAGVTGPVLGVVGVVEGLNQAVDKGHHMVTRAKAAAAGVGDFITPNKGINNTLGSLTSKRDKIAASKQVSRTINFGTPTDSTGLHRSINVENTTFGHYGMRRDDQTTGLEQPLVNMPAAMQVGNDGEVPVAKVPRLIAKIHPDVFNIRLPYYVNFDILNGDVERTNSRPLCLLRLNSIYDVMKNTHTATDYYVNPYPELPTVVPTAAQTAANANNPVANATTQLNVPRFDVDGGPVGRNIWQGHFKYYRVLRSDVKLTFVNKNCEYGSNIELYPNVDNISAWQNFYAVGYELIDEDGLLCQQEDAFMTAKGVVRDIMMPAMGGERVQVTATPGFATCCAKPAVAVMNYTYHPEAWNMHVEQKGQETRWTAVGSNPALEHLMALRAFHLSDNTQARSSSKNIGVMVQIEFEVQFRECLDNFIKEGYQQPSADT